MTLSDRIVLTDMAQSGVADGAVARVLAEHSEQGDDNARLRAIIANTLPYLEEAWKACFHGQEQRMLSAEERGMGQLLAVFRDIAAGKPTLPPGLITQKQAAEQTEVAIAWANRLLGQPNALRKPLQRWMHCGETCADGIERADAEVERLTAELAAANAEVTEVTRQRESLLAENTGLRVSLREVTAKCAAALDKSDAELAATNALLAKATEFRVPGWIVLPRFGGWIVCADNFRSDRLCRDGTIRPCYRAAEEEQVWPVAAEAVAAAEEAQGETK